MKDSCLNENSILIGGDLCPFGSVEEALIRGDASAVFNDLLTSFKEADFVLVNLECPFVENPSPIVKAGPIYKANSRCINGLKNANIHAMNLANNHILDHGDAGLQCTISTCQGAGIKCVGAGRNLHEARQLLIKTVGGLRVAFLGMAEQEFSIAEEAAWGANPFDLIDYCHIVKETKGRYDRLVVLLHAGAEMFPYPTPRLQKSCRFLVEQGADAVVCQHSHCAGVCELYHDAPIVYGQGNLIHEISDMDPMWYSGFMVKLYVDKDTPCFRMDCLPFNQSKGISGVSRMVLSDEVDFRQQMNKRAANIKEPGMLDYLWRSYCTAQTPMYLSYLRGHSRLLRRLNGRLHFAEHMYSQESMLHLLDLFRCDTHREAVECVIRLSSKDLNK